MKMKKFKRFISMAMAATMVVTSFVVPPSASTEVKAADKGYEERLTPLMGWSSWNEFKNHISEEMATSNMDLMVEYGLVDVGYTYFNLDDGFQAGRDKNGKLKHNATKFPNGMKYIADYAHDRGMKAGIYSDIGKDTCASGAQDEGNHKYQNLPGSGNGIGVGFEGHIDDDLKTYFNEWGYDFIKVDWCGGRNLGWKQPPDYDKNKTNGIDKYVALGEKIEAKRKELGRDIIYNVCCWRFPGKEIAVDSQADSWRSGGDLWADWGSITKAIDNVKNLSQYSTPGKSNDLDMMQVGRGLTYEEDKSHFSMWCMTGSPLMIGADLRKVTPETLEILKNEELIAIDQDPACIAATVVKTYGSNTFNDGDNNTVELWARDLGKKNSGTKAVAFLNRANKERKVEISWKELGFNGDVMVRDLWQHRYINVKDTHTVTIPAHGTVVYKVTNDDNSSGSGSTSGNVTIEDANIDFDMDVTNKNSSMNLTELGSADWLYYGKSGDTTFRRKAGVAELLKYSGGTTGSDDYYNDAATKYSWSDGTPQKSGSNVTQGLTIGKQKGAYGQIDAPSDSRKHTLYVPITGWKSNIKIEFLVNGKSVKSETVNEAKASDGQPRVNKLVKVTYSTDVPATVSVRWTIADQSASNGNAAVEGAALSIENKDDPAELCGVVNDVLSNEVDLAAEGTVDYVQFGGSNGDISAEKNNTDKLKKFATGSGAKVSSVDTTVTYKAGDKSAKKAASQSALNSTFKITLPKTDDMTQAKIYFGVKGADVSLNSVYGNMILSEKVVESEGNRVNKVASIYYKSNKDLTVEMKLNGTLGEDPQMTLDAVALKKAEGTVVLTPTVSQSDNTVNVSTRIIRQGNSTTAKKLELKAYDANGNAKKTETVNIADVADTVASGNITLDAGFSGKLEVKVLDGSNKTIGDTFSYNLPLGNRGDSGTIGRFTAMKLRKEGAILVDVRNPEELSEGTIEGSINIPYPDILTKAATALKNAGAKKDTNIIVYCKTGKRSMQARNLLMDILGYTNVYDIGGYENYTRDPSISFTNYQEVIKTDTNIYITMSDVEYDKVELKYSIGENSTIKDAKTYTGPFKLSKSERVKAYVMFEGEVVYQTSNEFIVHDGKYPDVTKLEGKYCSDMKPKSAYVARFTVGNNKTYYNDKTNEKSDQIDEPKNEKKIVIAGKTFDKGLYTHTPSTVTYEIPDGMTRFVAVAGWDDVAKKGNYTTLHRIYIDGQMMDRQVRLSKGKFYVYDIAIPEGSKELTLETVQGNSSLHEYNQMFTCWGIARFVKDPNADASKETGENIAKGKMAVSTYDQSDEYNAAKVVDGKLDTRWSSSGGDGLPDSVQIDLGSIYELSKLNTYWYANGRNYTYNVYLTETPMIKEQKLQKGTPTVAQQTGVGSGDGSKKTVYTFTGKARGRYLTIETTKASSNNLASIFEVEAYGIKVGETFVPTVIPGLETNPVDEVVNAIEAIGDVTLEKESKITAARAAYDALTNDQKKEVSADVLKKLTDAEDKLAELKEANEKPPVVKPLPDTDPEDTYEAEKAALTSACVISDSATSSNGKFVGELGGSKGGKATFTVKADKAGKYDLDIYYITHYDRDFEVTVNNGEAVTVNCVGNNTDWDATVQKVTKSVELNAGVNTIALGNTKDFAPNLDKIVVTLKEANEEVKPETDPVEAAKAVLQVAVDAAATYKEADYTEDSWSTFKKAYDAAVDMLKKETATEEEVNAAKDELVAAQNALEKVEVPEDDALKDAKAKLVAAVAAAKEEYPANQSKYTEETWAAFAKAYADATNPTAIAVATAEELTALTEKLNQAQAALAERPVEEQNAALETAKKNLADAVNAAKEIYNAGNAEGTYTEASWKSFEEALRNAEAAGEGATASELDILSNSLKNAQKGLEKANSVEPDVKDDELEKKQEELATAVAEAKEVFNAGQSNYTDDSWAAFVKAYEAARKPEADSSAEDLEALTAELKAAQSGLKQKSQDNTPVPGGVQPTPVSYINQVVVTADESDLYYGGNAGKTATMKVELPTGAAKKSVTYSTSDAKVAEVDTAGKITAVGKGDAVITATVTLTNGETKAFNVSITVKKAYIEKVKVKSTVKVGKKVTLKAKAYGSTKRITWKIKSGARYAKLTKTGKFTARAKGKVKVTAKSGKISKTFTIRVK